MGLLTPATDRRATGNGCYATDVGVSHMNEHFSFSKELLFAALLCTERERNFCEFHTTNFPTPHTCEKFYS